MPRLKKRADGRFRASFTYQGKAYYVYSRNRAELETLKAAKLKELEENKENYENPTLNDYYEHFTQVRCREVRGNTIRAQKKEFHSIAETEIRKGVLFGQLRIRDIKRRDIENVREIMLKNGKTPENLNICFAHLNHVLNTAVLDETILVNPCRQLKRLTRTGTPITDDIHGRHRALTEEETDKFFIVAERRKSYYINVFKMMLGTGMRIGEVSALYPIDIDRGNGYIHVRRTVTRNELGGYEIGENTKTENGVRDIPLRDDVYHVYLNQKELNRFLFGEEYSGLVFPSYKKEILREYTVNREIKRICKDAEIEPFTCHAFRATYATRFIEQRPNDYKTLSEVLGHKNISITLDLYTHVMNSRKVEAVNAVKIKMG